MKRFLLIFCFFISVIQNHSAQVGYGFTVTNDLYHRMVNPKEVGVNASRSAGSFLLNLGVGPKIWFGNPKFSFSLEAQASLGFLGLSAGDYKGLGTAAFPILGKFNFKGLSTFDREGKLGFSLGGGVQYNRTEVYGLTRKFQNEGVTRSFFTTYIVQAGYGFGISGFTIQGFLRLGYNPDTKANVGHFGIQYDFNTPMLKKITSPESEL